MTNFYVREKKEPTERDGAVPFLIGRVELEKGNLRRSVLRMEKEEYLRSAGSPQFPNDFSEKLLFHLTFNGNVRKFWNFWLNGKHPVARILQI